MSMTAIGVTAEVMAGDEMAITLVPRVYPSVFNRLIVPDSTPASIVVVSIRDEAGRSLVDEHAMAVGGLVDHPACLLFGPSADPRYVYLRPAPLAMNVNVTIRNSGKETVKVRMVALVTEVT